MVPGPPTRLITPSSGRRSIPSLFPASCGVLSEKARNYSSTVITNQLWIFGLRVLPTTPSLCTSLVQSSCALHPTSSLFLSLTFQVQTIPCFVPFSDVPVPSTRPAGGFGTHYPASLSTDPLAGCLAYLQSQAIAPSTCHTYSAGICRYASFCHSRQWTPFPASELQLRYFGTWLCDQVSFPTIKLYLAGIWFAHLENSLADPFVDAPLLHLLLRGIKLTIGLSFHRRLPITM